MTRVQARRFGRPLPDGGTIGVCAPSGPVFNTSDVLRPLEWTKSRGYGVKLAPGVWDKDDYVAGSPERRAEDIMALFTDPEVDVIMCLWGGAGAAEVLPHLDYAAIAAHPKAFIGFSDITALHTAIRQESGLATFHGAGFGSMGATERTDFTWNSSLAMLKGASGEVPRDPDDPYVRTITGGRVTAPIVGGNLWTLQHSLRTPWEIELEGTIFFFEEVDVPPYQLDAILWQLRVGGRLDQVAGVMVGEMHDCDWRSERPEAPRTRSLEDVLERHLAPLGVPVLYKLPLGHGKHLATIPLGVTATLDADARTLTIDQPGVVTGA